MVPTGSVFKNRDLTVVDGIVNFMYNTLKENNIFKKNEFNSKLITEFIMTCWDNLPMELRHLIFKFKRLNHFKQRMQTLSILWKQLVQYLFNIFANVPAQFSSFPRTTLPLPS